MTLSAPVESPILIVGAGPNGLVCAITLAKLGHKVTIVDALTERKIGARGALVHARTLEMLETVAGELSSCLAEYELGIKSRGVVFHSDTQPILNVDVASLERETKFPFVLLLSQEHVERALEKQLNALGVDVRWNTRVIGLENREDGDKATVKFADGSSLVARYIVGADGARSTIRTLSGIKFEDPKTHAPYDENVDSSAFLQITLADVYLRLEEHMNIPRNYVSWHLNGRIMFCPLQPPKDVNINADGKFSYWRIALVIQVGAKASQPPRHPDADYLQQEINRRKPWPEDITVLKCITASTYRVRYGVADVLFKATHGAKVCLVGDAAHVHSPTGGQGMNLGIVDSVMLARALDAHIADPRTDHSLQAYSDSRRANAIQVIEATKLLTKAINTPDGWKAYLRNLIMRVMGSLRFVRRRLAWKISGLAYR